MSYLCEFFLNLFVLIYECYFSWIFTGKPEFYSSRALSSIIFVKCLSIWWFLCESPYFVHSLLLLSSFCFVPMLFSLDSILVVCLSMGLGPEMGHWLIHSWEFAQGSEPSTPTWEVQDARLLSGRCSPQCLRPSWSHSTTSFSFSEHSWGFSLSLGVGDCPLLSSPHCPTVS